MCILLYVCTSEGRWEWGAGWTQICTLASAHYLYIYACVRLEGRNKLKEAMQVCAELPLGSSLHPQLIYLLQNALRPFRVIEKLITASLCYQVVPDSFKYCSQLKDLGKLWVSTVLKNLLVS